MCNYENTHSKKNKKTKQKTKKKFKMKKQNKNKTKKHQVNTGKPFIWQKKKEIVHSIQLHVLFWYCIDIQTNIQFFDVKVEISLIIAH